MAVRCRSKFVNRIAQEAFCRKKINRKLVRMRKSWDEVKKIINSRGCCS